MTEFAPPPAESILPSPLLVVEDEPLIRKRLEGILRSLGYTEDALVFTASIAETHARLKE
ncbi:MAG: DNA-binding response regulator, partial [Comamonas sp.]